jgi:hypothetical protein
MQPKGYRTLCVVAGFALLGLASPASAGWTADAPVLVETVIRRVNEGSQEDISYSGNVVYTDVASWSESGVPPNTTGAQTERSFERRYVYSGAGPALEVTVTVAVTVYAEANAQAPASALGQATGFASTLGGDAGPLTARVAQPDGFHVDGADASRTRARMLNETTTVSMDSAISSQTSIREDLGGNANAHGHAYSTSEWSDPPEE